MALSRCVCGFLLALCAQQWLACERKSGLQHRATDVSPSLSSFKQLTSPQSPYLPRIRQVDCADALSFPPLIRYCSSSSSSLSSLFSPPVPTLCVCPDPLDPLLLIHAATGRGLSSHSIYALRCAAAVFLSCLRLFLVCFTSESLSERYSTLFYSGSNSSSHRLPLPPHLHCDE